MPIFYDGGSGGGDSSNGAVTHPVFTQAINALLANGGGGGVRNSANSTHLQKIGRALAANPRARAAYRLPFRRLIW
jgi:hypothetical protein